MYMESGIETVGASRPNMRSITGLLRFIRAAGGGCALPETCKKRQQEPWVKESALVTMLMTMDVTGSMVRLSDGFFTLGTYIFELLFLFYFARYMAGVGKVGAGMLLLFSCGATLFAISTPVTKMLMYLLQDVEACWIWRWACWRWW